MRHLARVQPVAAYAASHLDEDVSLAALAEHAGLSEFHLQRVFSATLGESPKQYTLRLRLGRAAAMLLTTRDSVLDIALACGFQSHEVFTRAFRRRFGMRPSDYRDRGFAHAVTPRQRDQHVAAVNSAGPCIGLYGISTKETNPMNYEIVQKNLAPQPIIVVSRRVKRSEIAATIGETLPHIFMFAQQHGIALAGHPITRYSDVGPGLMTIEPAMRIASSAQAPVAIEEAWTRASGDAAVRVETLPGGPAATTMHAGSYDTLHEAYAALEAWIEQHGLTKGGAPWEDYITDPSEHPDPKDWRTEVTWPLAGGTAANPS